MAFYGSDLVRKIDLLLWFKPYKVKEQFTDRKYLNVGKRSSPPRLTSNVRGLSNETVTLKR